VAQLLQERFGLPVLDADRFARQALEPGTAALAAVLARYGEELSRQDGSLDRAALGRIVFGRPAERRWLEQLVHPFVRERFAEELERLADAPVVVLMIPLLFEAGLDHLCGEVWLVDCDEADQLRRLVKRDGLTEAEARARLASQWPQARKRPLADVLIDNRGTPDGLVRQLECALSPSASG
jgi:dephospho-CoA kinase